MQPARQAGRVRKWVGGRHGGSSSTKDKGGTGDNDASCSLGG